MKFLIIKAFVTVSFSIQATHDKCHMAVTQFLPADAEKIAALYDYKNSNHHQWDKSSSMDNIPYTLQPEKMTYYSLSWKITRPDQSSKLKKNSIVCDVVDSWTLSIKTTFTIVYPPAAHGLQEDTDYYHMTTFAGILLGKSEYPPHPDIAELYWHLKQEPIAQKTIDEIVHQYPFLKTSALNIKNNVLDSDQNVQLVALHFSSSPSLESGEQRWLITNARTHEAIRDGKYRTKYSLHDGWLPWYDASQPEFSQQFPHEVYRDTIVAPLTQAEIFDRSIGQYLPEPIAVIQEMQDIHDLIAPLVKNAEQGLSQLFVHLVLKKHRGFLLATFAVVENGQIILQSYEDFIDTAQLKLPSSHMLGFAL